MSDQPHETGALSLKHSGQQSATSSVVLVHTRFGLDHPSDLLRSYRDYREVQRMARGSSDLLLSCFLIEDLRTFHSLSFWRSDRGIALFGTNVPQHVDAARRAFRRLRFDQERGPELWSTRWRLESVSNNLRWPGLDLDEVRREHE